MSRWVPNDYFDVFAATDRQIDTLIYELYGLSGEEIKIVEATHE